MVMCVKGCQLLNNKECFGERINAKSDKQLHIHKN